MSKEKFNPVKCGLVKRKDKSGEIEYLYICEDEDSIDFNKVIGKLWHVNYFQGLPIEWEAFKIVHCHDGSSKEHSVFSGKIPTNAFGEQLIKNLFY